MKPDTEIKRIYRKVKPIDMEKYEEAKSREHATMIKSRKIAEDLGLQMKIGDVEYPPRMERRRTVPDPRRLCTGYGKVPSGRMGYWPGYVI